MSVCKGAPLPGQEQHAINAVMQYAIHRLGFQPDFIILFAWSIGGYAASWAAMSYPDVRHVVSSRETIRLNASD